jgi:hypothetical protein
MKVVINIKTDNAAFEDDPEAEVKRILIQAVMDTATGNREGNLRDSNGNKVGTFIVTGKTPF